MMFEWDSTLQSSPHPAQNMDSSLQTSVRQDTFKFLWVIKNFSLLKQNKVVESSEFIGGRKTKHHWKLHIYPRWKSRGEEYISTFLVFVKHGNKSFFSKATPSIGNVRFQFSLLQPNGETGHLMGNNPDYLQPPSNFNANPVWGYSTFIKSADATSLGLLQEDTLRVHCRIWIDELKHCPGDKFEKSLSEKRLERIGQDLKSLFTDGIFTDVALSTSTKTFMCHKGILACRSSVFASMFQNQMQESINNAVEIKDFEEGVVKLMIDYIYGVELENLDEYAAELMQIADKYDIQGLKEECEYFVVNNLTVENVGDILLMAHLHSPHTLKPKVIDFINRNKDAVKKANILQKVSPGYVADVFLDLYFSK